ncbi:hypothetical protein GCM10008955_16630 [Deinococcus malanensis]|uniref:DUF4064 domain-containing protein n=1 Tax=Deinococcus malanensis TaxID=1706855 RepID=A0ABQ2ESL9_9DEIO|nr:hypothetical protein [Deinococcus malanensis]GGK23700.1 hypothetical protein GCM10008955_16630 [Deinococcus malanensis]
MTHPSAPNSSPQPTGPKPKRLSFLTVPLLISLIYNAISLLTLPFSTGTINDLLAQFSAQSRMPPMQLTPEQITLTLWLSFFITVGIVLLLYFTRRAVLEGRAWGRGASIVIAVLSLLLIPFGTILGVVMLIGAFDREVQAYTRR